MASLTKHPRSTPVGLTSDHTIRRDLQASADARRIEEVLEELHLGGETNLSHLSRFVVSRTDMAAVDAALRVAADTVYQELAGDRAARIARDETMAVQAFYVSVGLRVIKAYEDALKGLLPRNVIEQASADHQNYMAKMAGYGARQAMGRVIVEDSGAVS